jgi:hypothetical protein
MVWATIYINLSKEKNFDKKNLFFGGKNSKLYKETIEKTELFGLATIRFKKP